MEEQNNEVQKSRRNKNMCDLAVKEAHTELLKLIKWRAENNGTKDWTLRYTESDELTNVPTGKEDEKSSLTHRLLKPTEEKKDSLKLTVSGGPGGIFSLRKSASWSQVLPHTDQPGQTDAVDCPESNRDMKT